ncbi:MAG: lytic transglycosylase domain-containing protein, partial [Acetivibrio sp.]
MSIEKVTRTVEAPKTLSGTSSGKFTDVLDRASAKEYSDTDLDGIFKKASDTYDVPLELLKSVAKAESNFDTTCVSKSGARGIMQLMPETAKGLGVTDSFDADQNIMGGAKYLSKKLEEYDGDVELALAAYNAGSGSVNKYGGIP